jgi:hypothetical protein
LFNLTRLPERLPFTFCQKRIIVACAGVFLPLLPLLLGGCRQSHGSISQTNNAQPSSSEPLRSPEQPVQAQFRHVNFHVDNGVILRIRSLRGELVSTGKDTSPRFDDARSFVVKIYSAEIGITTDHLADLLNRYVLAYDGAPLRKISISAQGNRLKQKGILMKGAPIPFEVEGTLSPTAEGLIAFHVGRIKSGPLPVKGLMDLLGVKLADLININQQRGLGVQGDDILLYPDRIVPPPRIEGRVTGVHVEGQQIVLIFGASGGQSSETAKALSPPRPEFPNYMYFRGGTLRFGKLTMRDADLQIIDTHADDYFEFDLAQYNRQLTAGYTKNTPSYGLLVFMPDLNRIPPVEEQRAPQRSRGR